MKELKSVGTTIKRRDGEGHIKGQTEYVDDIPFQNLKHLHAVRSPVAHAEIKGLDFSAAEEVDGFVDYLTHEDVPNNLYTILRLVGVGPDEEPLLAEDRVRYEGEPIAAVIADSKGAAMEAASKVEVDLEELPAVFDVEEALEDDAPILKDWGTNHFEFEGHHCRRVRRGDVDAAFEEADHIVEGRYQTSPIEQAPTETTSATAKPEANGRFTVHTNTQALFFSLDNTAITLDIPFEKLQFKGGTVGGGFGGKVDVIVEQLATLGAKKTGYPVRYKFTREEEMKVSSPRGAWRMYFKDGVTDDGEIIAREVTSYADAGAYNRHTPYAVTKHAANLAGPYNIPNAKFDCYCVYTNKQPSSAMRGFGVTPCSFAIENHMDKIADELGLDRWEVRFKNAYKNGDITPHRKEVEDASLIECMQSTAEMIDVDLPEEFKQMSSLENTEEHNV
ncbi:xanthine dehydrogenase family protein molybdopterin-binding subunit (plasmid) [Salinigranum rubrum]|uniref:Xanthine dehydrogenase family protein molybdopterin-binding subunit n=1 Tax=Salinigranum rubrum TaxID=755307 RepID=A0A2I8VQH0_9EURY|nr:molybdopterin cofactor-binding domain-containing protein [Salinigranum rubrum]AUV84173.1 xanthine dehydrogenase family protein molybdopterin-binding subunit [Salinigranum rubrum]